MPAILAHALALGWFLLLAIGLSCPLIRDLGAQIPGSGAGDNVVFLWNFWWFRFALEHSGIPLFHTPYLFAPFGTSLVLHTHTALEALAGGTVLRGVPVIAAHNIVLLAGLAANGAATYALAFYHVRRSMPAVLAGVVFASSAYIAIRLLGHFNLVHAWVIPLAALAWIACLDRPTRARAAAVAVAFGATTYSDYYYLTYSVIFALGWWLVAGWRVQVRQPTERFARAEKTLLGLMLVLALVAAGILATGGFQLEFGPLRLSASRPRNSLAGLWLLAMLWCGLQVRLTRRAGGGLPTRRAVLQVMPVTLLLYALIVLPLAVPAVALVTSGQYVGPDHSWQSGPKGVDLATMVLGNPLHPLYGIQSRAIYERAGIDLMEQAAWLGLVPMLMLAWGIKTRLLGDSAARLWLWTGALFLTWSAGSFLVIAGTDTGLPLPQALARYVPLLSNARMPGRGVVMVQLASAVLCAIVVARREWSSAGIGAAVAVALLDGSAVPYPMFRIPAGTNVESVLLADARDGSVLELPAGLRDGLGTLGEMDHRALVHQMTHQRPLVGGFVARLAPSIRERYLQSPALIALIRLRERRGPVAGSDLPPGLAHDLRAYGIRYIVVNADVMGQPLRGPLEEHGIRLIVTDGWRELYEVTDGDRGVRLP